MKNGRTLLFLGIIFLLFAIALPTSAEEGGGYSYTIANGEVTIYSTPISLSGDVVVPERIEGYPVTKIQSYAFSSRKNITSVQLPSTITSIGSYAFQGCSSLVSVSIPDSEVSLGEGVFKECTALESCVFPKGMTEIPPETFWGCTSLKTIMIPENVQSVGRSAFQLCSSVTEIYIPKSVTEIGYVAFDGCESVEKITIPFVGSSLADSSDSVFGEIFGGINGSSVPQSLKEVVILGGNSIPTGAFEDCGSIEKIYIPDSISEIGDKAFYSCFSLKEIVVDEKNSAYQSKGNCLIERATKRLILGCETSIIPDDGTVTTICAYAFSNCANLKKIVVPNSIRKIERYAFSGCSSLEEISIPFVGEKASNTSNTHFGYIFGAGSIESHNAVFIPQTLKTVVVTGACSIAPSAFDRCRNIVSFTATSNIKNIGEFAFLECSALKFVRFEGALQNVGQSAFLDCVSLKEILLPNSIQNIGNGVFGNCPDVKILCEKDSVAQQYAIKNRIAYEIIEMTHDSESETELESDTETEPVTELESNTEFEPNTETESEQMTEPESEHKNNPRDDGNSCEGSINSIAIIVVVSVVSGMLVLGKKENG